MKPKCGIDYQRLFSLPFGVAPESLGDMERMQYAVALRINGKLEHSTLDGFRSIRTDAFLKVRPLNYGDGSGAIILLHQNSNVADFEPWITLVESQVDSVTRDDKTNTKYLVPAGLTQSAIADKIAETMFRDTLSLKLSKLSLPATPLDGIQLFWPKVTNQGFPHVLGLNLSGVLPLPGGSLPQNVPEYLLETRVISAETHLGEVQRLLLRAPVVGQYRFEPYFHYRKQGDAVSIVGRSHAGRLVVNSLKLRSNEVKTDTRLYLPHTFIFENVDRLSVASVMYRHLVLQLSWFAVIDEQFKNRTSNEPRLAISRNKVVLYNNIRDALKRCLRSWIAFLTILAPTADDQAIAQSIPSEWWRLVAAPSIIGDKLISIIQPILDNTNWQEALLRFLRDYYTPVMSGFSWYEVFKAQGLDESIKFPIPEDMPPKSPKDQAKLNRVHMLEQVDRQKNAWIACYAGAPLGVPAPVYADTAVPPGSLERPNNAVTCYELEAALLAGRNTDIVSTPTPPSSALASPGKAADLSVFSAKQVGNESTVWVRDPEDSNRTAVDWFMELTQGVNVQLEEPPIIDIEDYVDLASATGHPLYTVMHHDEYLQAKSLRRQMDNASTSSIEDDSLAFWDSKLNIPRDPVYPDCWDFNDPLFPNDEWQRTPGPTDPFLKGKTLFPFTGITYSRGKATGIVDYNNRRLSGFDHLDLQSAILARSRMTSPLTGKCDLPLPVIMALMQKEGIFSFAFLNRYTQPTKSLASTLSWIAYYQDMPRYTAVPLNALVRCYWLLWPYGLDYYAVEKNAATNEKEPRNDTSFDNVVKALRTDSILTTEIDEDVRTYIDEKIWGVWQGTNAAGRAIIWKLTRRVHWAFVSLMVGRFLSIQKYIHEQSNGFARHDDWIDTDKVEINKIPISPNKDAWRHFITYYSMIYRGYNARINWTNDLNNAYASCPAGRSLRDHLFFHHQRLTCRTQNMVQFGIALDAYMRLDLLNGKSADQYSTAAPDLTAISRKSWGA